MSVSKLSIEEFIQYASLYPVIDVRSEGEFNHAHVPNAYSFPLFNNDERKIVGTIYKQQSREQAIKKGLDFFGPKMKEVILFAERLNKKLDNNNKTFIVHCWRGGMRSAAIAWLLDIYGFKVYTLSGGYKAFRKWVIGQFEKDWNINIIGGYTGSGKTVILEEIKKRSELVIDLEGLAGHRGSAFGRIGLPEQTSVEMFENKLACSLQQLGNNVDKPIWIEDESQRIGAVSIPHTFWATMRKSMVYFLDIPFEKRLGYLVDTYGKMDKTELASAIVRIQKKLGGLETKNALQFLNDGQLENCFEILLKYYDKLYLKSLQSRNQFDDNKKTSKDNRYEIEENSVENNHGLKSQEREVVFKKNVYSNYVDPFENSNKLMEAFYGRN